MISVVARFSFNKSSARFSRCRRASTTSKPALRTVALSSAVAQLLCCSAQSGFLFRSNLFSMRTSNKASLRDPGLGWSNQGRVGLFLNETCFVGRMGHPANMTGHVTLHQTLIDTCSVPRMYSLIFWTKPGEHDSDIFVSLILNVSAGSVVVNTLLSQLPI